MLPPSDNWGPVSRGWCMSYPVVHSPLHPMCTALLPLSQLHYGGNLRRCTWSSAGQTNNRSADHKAFLTTSRKYHCANANMKLTNIYNSTAKLSDFVNVTCQEKKKTLNKCKQNFQSNSGLYYSQLLLCSLSSCYFPQTTFCGNFTPTSKQIYQQKPPSRNSEHI